MRKSQTAKNPIMAAMSTGNTESNITYNLNIYLHEGAMSRFEIIAMISPPPEAITMRIPFLSEFFPISRKTVALTIQTQIGNVRFKK